MNEKIIAEGRGSKSFQVPSIAAKNAIDTLLSHKNEAKLSQFLTTLTDGNKLQGVSEYLHHMDFHSSLKGYDAMTLRYVSGFDKSCLEYLWENMAFFENGYEEEKMNQKLLEEILLANGDANYLGTKRRYLKQF